MRVDLVSSSHRGPSKDQLSKNQDRDENIAKMLTQLELFTNHVMGRNHKRVNVLEATSDVIFGSTSFEGDYNKEVDYMGNQMVGSRLTFSRQLKNQGLS